MCVCVYNLTYCGNGWLDIGDLAIKIMNEQINILRMHILCDEMDVLPATFEI